MKLYQHGLSDVNPVKGKSSKKHNVNNIHFPSSMGLGLKLKCSGPQHKTKVQLSNLPFQLSPGGLKEEAHEVVHHVQGEAQQ